MENEYLPIGSVVLLKNAKKRVMITGFYVSSQEVNSDKVYDYVGCLYPEGIISSSQNLVFNNDQISQIIFVGYRDIEEQLFKEQLVKSIKEKNKIDNKKEMENPIEDEKEIEEMETLFDEQLKSNEIDNPLSDNLDIEESGILFDEDSKLDDKDIPLEEETIVEKSKLDSENLNLNDEENVRPSIYDELEVLDPDNLYASKDETKENDDLEDISGNFIDFENTSNDIDSFDDELLYGNDDINKDLEKIDF